MTYYLAKVVVTTLMVLVISEVAKRSYLLGALIASLPVISILAMLWLYFETKDTAKVSTLSINIFWLVIPSLALFLSLFFLLKQGLSFYLGLAASIAITVVCYLLMLTILNHS